MAGMAHNRLEYRHALRGIAYLRMLAGERSPKHADRQRPMGQSGDPGLPADRRGRLDRLKGRIEELVRKAAERL
jgi:hypothetical protein